MRGFEGWLRFFQHEECAQQRACASEEQEGRGDLCNGENALTAAAATGNTRAAAGQTQSARAVSRRQARDKREEHGGDGGEGHANPKHAGIEREAYGANGEARGVAAEHCDHGRGNQNAG